MNGTTIQELFDMLPESGGSGFISLTDESETALGIVIFAKGKDAQALSDLYEKWDSEGDDMK